MRRYPFMNNNGCQICFILLPNLLMWIEMINIQKLVTHITHCLSGVQYLYVCYTAAPDSFKAPGQSGARPVTPTTGTWLRALNDYINGSMLKLTYIWFIYRANRLGTSFSNQDVIVTVPKPLDVQQIDYIGVWCQSTLRSLGRITIPSGFLNVPAYFEEPYLGKYIGDFQIAGTVRLNSHRVRGAVYAVDERTIIIKDFTFDGYAPSKLSFIYSFVTQHEQMRQMSAKPLWIRLTDVQQGPKFD